VVVGITNVIPFFGPFLGAIPSTVLIFLASPIKAVYFVLFVLALQQLDGNVIGPKILGDSTGISSFWVIVSILVGGGFFGVLGMFFGVPVFAAVRTLIKYLVDRRLAGRDMPLEASAYIKRDLRQPPDGVPEQETKE
jgi:predicted PurR-regulated permease PerM